jgi:hydroxymethylpyrimidine/phosphomethylpyrimidine kinase
MISQQNSVPILLAIGGHDPSGGAGIQADIEAAAAKGTHAVTLVTCLTLQDSCNVRELHPVGPELLEQQLQLLLVDCRPTAIKIGLLGSAQTASALARLLRDLPDVPLVFDPVLAAGGGSDLADAELLNCLRQELLPLCSVLTPNIPEAVRLSGLEADAPADDCAAALLSAGCGAVLITGTHDHRSGDRVVHRLFQPQQPVLRSEWPRLPGEFHGSGCTLAAAIAAGLANGDPLHTAVQSGLEYTWQSLNAGFRSGRCQSTPDRFHQLDRWKERPHE